MSEASTLNISQEFFAPGKILNNLPKFVESLQNHLTSLSISGDLAKPLNYRRLDRDISKTPYTDLREVMIYVPAGLGVTYLDYLKVLESAVKVAEGLDKNVLQPFSRWLAIGLANPETFASVKGNSSLKDFNPHNIDRVLMELGDCYSKGSNVHSLPYKNAFARNADLSTAMDLANTLNERFAKTSPKAIREKVQEISEKLDILTTRIEEAEENYDFSPVSIEVLSKLSFTLAQEVEFYGTVGYQVTSTVTALHDTSQKLEDHLKKSKR